MSFIQWVSVSFWKNLGNIFNCIISKDWHLNKFESKYQYQGPGEKYPRTCFGFDSEIDKLIKIRFYFRTLKRERICLISLENGKRGKERLLTLLSQSDPVAKWRNKKRKKTRRGFLLKNENCSDSLQTLCSNCCDSNLCDYQFFIAQFYKFRVLFCI